MPRRLVCMINNEAMIITSLICSLIYKWAATWDFQQCGMCDQQRLKPACAYAVWSEPLLVASNLLTEHNLWFLSLKVGCTGLSVSTLVKMPNCWKSHVKAQILMCLNKESVMSWITSSYITFKQDCGNTMPDLSDLVQIHSGQVENFY